MEFDTHQGMPETCRQSGLNLVRLRAAFTPLQWVADQLPDLKEMRMMTYGERAAQAAWIQGVAAMVCGESDVVTRCTYAFWGRAHFILQMQDAQCVASGQVFATQIRIPEDGQAELTEELIQARARSLLDSLMAQRVRDVVSTVDRSILEQMVLFSHSAREMYARTFHPARIIHA